MKRIILATIMSTMLLSKATAQPFHEMAYSPEQTTFSLFAPNDAKKVTVRIYREGLGGKAVKPSGCPELAMSSGQPPSRAI